MGLGTIEDVGRAKGELYSGLGPAGTAVVNLDDPVVQRVAVPRLGSRKRLTFGTTAGADVLGCSGNSSRRSVVGCVSKFLGREYDGELPLVGPHNAMNAAAAVAGADAILCDFTVNLRRSQQRLLL